MDHYDYMCVRSERLRECECRYARFGWRYVCDASEKGGGISFRRNSKTKNKRELDSLQQRCDITAAEIDRLRNKCRMAGRIASGMTAFSSFIAVYSGMNVLMRGSVSDIAVGGCLCVIGLITAALSFAAGRIVRGLAMTITDGKRRRLSDQLSEILTEAEKVGNTDTVL